MRGKLPVWLDLSNVYFQITDSPSLWFYENGIQITEQPNLEQCMAAFSSKQNKEGFFF